ncbi:MAG TPA: LytTR family DNA-binding domain-containing protein [Ginsengibacter sp.]|nr:LytTR family DNA-binding domain-containing protein [Ginsengibacter sp.]
MIRALIIDDEPHSTDRITHLLSAPEAHTIEIAGTCHTAEEAFTMIEKEKPNLVFLDVELGNNDAFVLLRQLPEINFEIIFITGHEQYAVKAFRFSAFDYLLKPIDPELLFQALERLSVHLTSRERSQKIETLLYNLSHGEKNNKRICIPTNEGFTFAETQDIIRCEALANYTVIYFNDQKKITVARTLKEFEHLLEDCNFYRVHNSHLVNLKYIKSYKRGKGGTLSLTDGTQIEVSTRRKDDFLKKISGF